MLTRLFRNLLNLGQPAEASQEEWRQKIKPLEERAFTLAIERWRRNAPLDEAVSAEAQHLQEQLRAFTDELRARQPQIYDSLSPIISEALLDFNYAVKAPAAVSLRLHHYIEGQQAQNPAAKPATAATDEAKK